MQVPHNHLVQELRQAWAAQTHLLGGRIEFQPQGSLKQTEWGCARPGMRRAGYVLERASWPGLWPSRRDIERNFETRVGLEHTTARGCSIDRGRQAIAIFDIELTRPRRLLFGFGRVLPQ